MAKRTKAAGGESKHDLRKSRQPLTVIPPQRRPGQHTLDSIVQSAERLISQRNFNEVSLEEICAGAGVSTGAFYRQFSNKESLLQYLHVKSVDRYLEHFSRDYSERAWAGRTLRQCLELMVGTALRDGAASIGYQRAALERTFADGDFRNREAQVHRAWAESFYRCVLGFRAEIDHPDIRGAADFCARMALAVCVQHNQLGELEPQIVPKSRRRLMHEVVDSCLGYLRWSGPREMAAASGAPVDASTS